MDFVPFICFCLTIGLTLSVVRGETEIRILGGNRVEEGATVDIICSIDPKVDHTIVWSKKFGAIEMVISDSIQNLISDFYTEGRYSLSLYGGADGKYSAKLTITDVKYEDTSAIGCRPRSKNDKAFVTLAVCEDTTSTACECVERTGWNRPSCFEKPVSVSKLEDKYDRTVTGLAVCLGIAVIFGVIMAILVGWDCMAKVAAKKKRQMEMQKAKMAAKRAGYTGYEESEKIDLDPNDTASNPDYDGFRSGTKSPAAVNAYASMNPNGYRDNGYRDAGNTHVNRAYMMDDDTERYHELGAAAAPPPRYGAEGAMGRVPEPAAEIEVHTVDEDLRARMEFDRSTPEGSVGSAKNNEPPSSASNHSRYDLRSPRYNDYNSNKSPGYGLSANKYPSLGFDDASRDAPRHQPDSYNNYNDSRNKSPATWSTKSAGLPPSAPAGNGDYYAPERNAYSEKPPRDFQGRSGYSEPRQLDFTHGKSGGNSYGDAYEQSGAYMDKTDTVV